MIEFRKYAIGIWALIYPERCSQAFPLEFLDGAYKTEYDSLTNPNLLFSHLHRSCSEDGSASINDERIGESITGFCYDVPQLFILNTPHILAPDTFSFQVII
jgi:hypothetical protein